MRTVVIRAGHAKPLWAGHPWVHAKGILRVEGEADVSNPDLVRVEDQAGHIVGHGFFAPDSALAVRLLGLGMDVPDPEIVLDERVRAAAALRGRLFPDASRTNAYRVVHAEGDRLPGLVVDRFGDVLVAQFATAAMHRRREALAAVLLRATGAKGLLARPGGYEAEEGIPKESVEFERGDLPDRGIEIVEEGLHLEIDPRRGQKTGHFVDQRENRRLVAELTRGLEVLDVFSGTGGFALQALRHGAKHALAVEVSERAAQTAERGAALNGVAEGFEALTGDARAALRRLKDEGRVFDVVVLDPPNLFPKRGREGNARKAYRDMNVQALTRTKPGGYLATFSCSARFDALGLREVLASAARECRRSVAVLRELTAGPDHPFLLAAPEGRYLTGLLVRVAESGSV